MKKRYVLLFIVLLCLAMPCVAFAHSGGTDEDGGHTDHSTGEYHYHHGYPAHDHYDMDGDGDLDCPHNFVDRTGYNSGSSSSSYDSYDSYSSTQVVTQTETVYVDKWYIPDWWIVLFFIVLGLCIVFFFSFRKMKTTLSRKEKENMHLRDKLFDERRAHENALKESKLELLKKTEELLAEELGENWMYVLSKAPNNAYINSRGLPRTDDGSDAVWGLPYTFYSGATDRGKRLSFRYHRITCRYANPSNPVNAQEAKRHMDPCSCCSPVLPDLEWIDRYWKIKRFFQTK